MGKGTFEGDMCWLTVPYIIIIIIITISMTISYAVARLGYHSNH